MEREWINQYEEMATYYNQLMLAGYYDYQQQSLSLAKILPLNASVLEIGIGTGLMAQQLKKDGFKITGVDHSQAMLAQAKELLGSDVRLELADITNFNLGEMYQVILSNGGVWYSVKWPDNSLGYCGHLRDKEDIKRSIENVCLHLLSGGQLVLSVQEAHQDKKIQLSDDIVYEQRIEDIGNGVFNKEYIFTSISNNQQVCYQRLTLCYIDNHFMERVLLACGLVGPEISPDGMYITFKKI